MFATKCYFLINIPIEHPLKFFSNLPADVCLLICAFIFCSLDRSRAESFGIHYLGNTTASVTGTAGVVAITNWNNVTNTTFASGTIHSSDGSVAATLAMSGADRTSGWNSGATADGGNGSLLDGYNDAGENGSVTNQISGLTNLCYTVYLFAEGDTSRPSNGGDWLPNYTINGIRYYTATTNKLAAGFVAGGFALNNTNLFRPVVTYGNDIEIDDVVPVKGVITISANSDTRTFRSPLNGIELVGDPLPADAAIGAYDSAFLIESDGQTDYASSLTNAAPDYFWSQALDIQGLEDAYERTRSPQQRQLIDAVLSTFLVQNPEPWTWDGWNDDIGWVSLVMARGYQMTGNTNLLNAAEYGFNMAYARGWDTHFNGGGIWEEQGYNGKTPLANNSLGLAATMIYQSTSNSTYLSQAEEIYAWGRTNIFDPATGLVYEEVDTNGTVNTSPALYNQGTFVDYANLLCQITGQTNYESDALSAVEYARNHLTVNSIFSNDAPYLNTWAAEFARGLGHFVADNHLWSTYYPWMLANAEAAWNTRRTDLNITWNGWTEQTSETNLTTGWCVSAVAMLQVTPTNEPGFVACTNQLHGTVIGTPGSWDNSGNTIANVFDGDINTFFDGPNATGDWAGLDFGTGASNLIGQINYWPRAGWSERMPGGVFQGANNPMFLNPVTLFTIKTAPPEEGVVTSQTITNQTAFRYVRYLGPTNGWCDVAEVQFFAPNPLPPPPLLTNRWDGAQLTLSWSTGGMLLQATNVTGPWTTNAAATSPLVVTPAQPQEFYRVQF